MATLYRIVVIKGKGYKTQKLVRFAKLFKFSIWVDVTRIIYKSKKLCEFEITASAETIKNLRLLRKYITVK